MRKADDGEMYEAIAIIGMAGRFPGAKNVEEFWNNLCGGVESVSFFTAEELQASGIDPAVLNDPTFINAGAIVDGADCFDAAFFGFTPREAEVMDPQHRIFLECAWEALEHAGYDPETYSRPIGVFGGVGANSYFQHTLGSHPALLESIGAYTAMLGNAAHFPTTRVSYKLNLKGPSINVYTACSTSGVAIHMASQSLLSGECDMALAGGMKIRAPLKNGYFYQPDGIFSPDGHCRAFDANAQGTISGDGGAILVLKRLSDALQDNDSLYAVIRASAINNDGSTKVSFAAPSVQGQAAAITEAHALAGISADSITYIEAHGTGTALGDPIEIAALTRAFRETTDKKQFCAIGSVKTNIGHLDAGAGVTGVLKAALALKHKCIPPSLHFQKPNPQIDFQNSPFYVNTKLSEWKEGETPRRAGVSSFGIGGTNAHIVLEEPPVIATAGESRPWQLLVLSTKTPTALAAATDNLAEYLHRHPDVNLADVAYTLSLGRRPFSQRRIVVCQDVSDAEHALKSNDPKRVVTQVCEGQSQSVVFMFPGGGAQYVNMGQELYERELFFREQVDECLALLQPHVSTDLKHVLFPTVDTVDAATHLIEQPPMALPLLFTLEWAMARLLISWGIHPAAMIGHSMGEYTAACLSGVISLTDALALVALRGRLFATLPAGAMLSISAPEEAVRALMGNSLSIAAINKPSSCVVSGEVHAIDEMERRLTDKSIDYGRVHISVAAHSQMVEPILREFGRFVEKVELRAPSIPYVSNVTGTWITAAEATDPRYWVKHLRQTVRFSDGLRVLMKETGGVLAEVGPGQTLSTFARQHPDKSAKQTVVSSFRHVQEQTSDIAFLLKTLGRLWLAGVEVDWSAVYRDEQRQRIALPTYPFERKRYWLDPAKVPGGETIARSNGQAAQPNATHENRTPPPSPVTTREEPPPMSLESHASVESKPRRQEAIVSTLKQVLEQLSGITAAELDEHATFLEMGFDSLFLTRANVAFGKKFGVKVTFRQLFRDCPTLSALAEYIDGELPPEESAPAVTPSVPVSPSQQAPAAQPSSPTSPSTTSLPAATSQSLVSDPASTSALERVINQQLQVMSEQLAVLRHGRSSEAETRPAESSASAPLAVAAPPVLPLDKPKVTHPIPVIVNSEVRKAGPQTPGNWKPIKRGGRRELTQRQQQYLDTLVTRYTTRTQGSKRLTQTQRLHLSDPRAVTGFNRQWKEMVYQLAMVSSSGSKLIDVDGNEYVDLTMGFGVNLFGYSPAFVTKAVEEQLKQGVELGVLSPLTRQVANTICEITGMDRATFLTTGSEANNAALRAARTVTGREKIAVFAGSYHGIFDEMLVQAITINGERRSVPVAPGIPGRAVEDVIVLDYGDPQSLEILRKYGDQLAAVFVEAVQSRHPDLQPRQFLHSLREITERTGTALVFDEVITGFRLHPKGAQGWYGVQADLACYGKLIGGAMPISVLAGKAVYMDAFDGGSWDYGDDSFPEAGVTFFGGTFVKHPLSLAAAAVVLDHLQQSGPALQQHLNERTSQLVNELNGYFAQQRVSIWIEHCGSMMFVTFPDDNDLARLLFYSLRAKGVHIWERPAFLSTAHTEEDLAFITKAVRDSVAEMKEAGILPESPGLSLNGSSEAAVSRNGSSSNFTELAIASSNGAGAVGPQLEMGNGHSDTPYEAPTTEAQLELWHASQMGTDASCAFNLSYSIHLRGQLQQEALRQSLQQVIDRHDALRATFSPGGELMRIAPLHIDLPTLNYSGSDRDQRMSELLATEVQRPFDLINGPLIRAHLVKLEEQYHLLLLTFHHIVSDGMSCGTVIRDLGTYYSAACRQARPELPTLMQFSEYARWQQEEKSGSEYAATEKYWVQLHENIAPILELPLDRPRPPMKTFTGAETRETLDQTLCTKLRKLGAQHGSTLFSTILAAYAVFLHRLTGQDDIVVSTPSAGQSSVSEGDLVGHCVNFHPLRFFIDSEQPFTEFLASVQNAVLDAYDHRNYTFGSLLKKLKFPRDPSRSPLVAAEFNLDRETNVIDFAGLGVEVKFNRRHFFTLDLGLDVSEVNGELKLRWDYNPDLFDANTILRWMRNFQTLLQSIVADSEQRISALSLLTAQENHQVLVEWNTTQAAYPQDRCVHQLFEEQVTRTPDALAVSYANQRLTYRELDTRANQLAHHLQRLGVGPDTLVGLCVERSLEMLVGMLGVLKAGAAYVPLDPSYPKERVQFMLEDATPPVLLTQAHLRETLPFYHGPVLCLDSDWERIGRESETPPVGGSTPENLAYTIYTSGSTGKPKGVQIPHRAVVNFLASMQQKPGMTSQDVLISVTTPSFDIAALELFLPLIVGARLVIASRDVAADGARLREALETIAPTVMQATPVTWRMLLEAGWEGNSHLKILCGGEALAPDLGALLCARGREVWNLYGPTETTIWSSVYQVSSGQSPIPIGRPIANTQIYILDHHGNPVPIGVVGELHIGGKGVARGYLKRPELTEEKFIPHRFSDEPGARLYKTGDLARYRADGNIEVLGRTDQQIKLRGFRIELDEIAAVLTSHPAVHTSVVVVREVRKDDKRLIAYVVPQSTTELTASMLREYAKTKLPDYMIPATFVTIASLPLTPNGKIDRRALPAPSTEHYESASTFVAPTTRTEQLLASIWEEVLDLRSIGVQDNFFELGGHSLLAVQILSRIRTRFSIDLPLRNLFETPTIAGLATTIESLVWVTQEQALVSAHDNRVEIEL